MIGNIINLIVECMKLLLVLCGIMNFKIKKSISALVLFGMSFIVLVLIGIYDNNYQVSIFMIVAIVICALAVEGKRRFIFATVAFLGICCLDDLLVRWFMKEFSISDEAILNDANLFSAVNSVSLLLLTVVSFIMQNMLYKREKNSGQILQKSNSLYVILLIIGEIASLLFIAPVTNLSYTFTDKNNRVVAWATAVLCLLFLVLGILLIYNNHSRNNYKQLSEMNQKLLESQQKYYQMVLEKENETRRFRHDINKHILCVLALVRENKFQEVEGYLEELKGVLGELTPRYQTGNMLVNAIINDVSNKYDQVNLVWEGTLPKHLQMSNMDICTIFSNLLDNAFCAAAECQNDKTVSVVVKVSGNGLIISVENDIAKPVHEVNGTFITQKADKKNHGIGTENVKNRVKAMGGSVEFSYTDKKFGAELVLPEVI